MHNGERLHPSDATAPSRLLRLGHRCMQRDHARAGQRGGGPAGRRDRACLPALLDCRPFRAGADAVGHRIDAGSLLGSGRGGSHRSARGGHPGGRADAGDRHAKDLGLRIGATLAACGLFALPEVAAAQTQFSPVCGVTGYATAPASITYDPFAPGGLSQATIPLILQRTRNLLLGRTDEVSLVLVAPAGSPPLQVTYQGQSVLYQEGTTAGRPRALDSRDNGAGAAGEIRYRFGGLFASDLSAPLNLRVTVPQGTDLAPGEPLYLDILYICSGDGGMLSVPSAVRESRAIRLDVNTVSALQAYYAGSALDFGEIGDATTQQVLAAPDRYTTATNNSLRVRSSGPFEVRVRSQNDFRLTYPGGNTGSASETIRYSVRFLGQDIASNASFGTRTCARAGVAGAAGVLPIRARLTEGGSVKTPSPAYADTVTITFTPLVSASAAQSCAGL